jgi:hypothetical protein
MDLTLSCGKASDWGSIRAPGHRQNRQKDRACAPADRQNRQLRTGQTARCAIIGDERSSCFRSDWSSDSSGHQTQMTLQNESRTDPGKKLSLFLLTISQ